MPFVALNRQTKARIDITALGDDPRQELGSLQVECPFCEAPMFIRQGWIHMPHFAHRRACTSSYVTGETPQHRLAKRWVAAKMRREYPDPAVVIELEKRLPHVGNDGRVADVLMTFPNGWQVAHECQLAAIDEPMIQQRTEDYEHAGIEVVWWLGQKAQGAEKWCMERFGFCLKLTFRVVETTEQLD